MTDQVNGSAPDSEERRPGVREKAGEALVTAYSTSRDKAGEAVEAARAQASLAARRAADGIQDNPIAALVGGLALGAVAGALLPASRREAELLGPLGSRVGEAGKAAAQAAREAGQQRLADLGISRESAREQVSKIFDGAVKAAGEAGSAAAKAARQSQSEPGSQG